MSQKDNENLDSQNETETDSEETDDIEETSLEETDDAGKLKEQNTKLADANKKLFERAKKAEGFIKQADGTWVKKPKAPEKPANPPQPPVNNNNAQLDPEELKLIAKGISDEEIAQAKVIAKGKGGIPLTEAMKDPLFIAFQKELKEQEKKENAKLGASQGSGQDDPKKEFKPGMSADDHKKAWKEKMGK